jgi:hypothetical protein
MALFERVELWDKRYTGTKRGEEKSQFWLKMGRSKKAENMSIKRETTSTVTSPVISVKIV